MSPLFHSTELVSTILNLREIELPDFTQDPNNIAPVILPGIGVKQEGHESDVDIPPVVCEPPLSHETGKDSDKEADKKNDMETEIADSTGGSQGHEPAALEPVMDASDGKDNETAKDGKEFEMEVKDGKDNETAKDGKEREMEVKDGKDNETAQDGKEHEMEVKDGKDNGTAKDGKEREMEAKDNNDNETAQAGKEREMEAKVNNDNETAQAGNEGEREVKDGKGAMDSEDGKDGGVGAQMETQQVDLPLLSGLFGFFFENFCLGPVVLKNNSSRQKTRIKNNILHL